MRSMLWNGLLRLQRIIMLATICFTTSAIFVEVIMRYVFKSPFVGLEELAAYVAFWLYFIGGSYGSYERSHISADLSQLLFKNKLHYAKSRSFTSLVSTALCLYVLPWAYDYVKWGFAMNEQSRATMFGETYPVVYFQASIFIGLALMAFYFFVEFCQWAKAAFITHEVPKELLSPREEIGSWIG